MVHWKCRNICKVGKNKSGMPPEFCVVDDYCGKNEALCDWLLGSAFVLGKGDSIEQETHNVSPGFKMAIDDNSSAAGSLWPAFN